MTLKVFVLIQCCYVPSYIIPGLMVSELHDMRIVCLLKAVNPAWVTNTVRFMLVINYIRYSGSVV